jgi:hypothetical protein
VPREHAMTLQIRGAAGGGNRPIEQRSRRILGERA